MKNTGLLLTFSLLLMAVSGFSQEIFKVLASKGANEYKSGNAWHPVKIGTALMLDDELKIPHNAYLGLVHNSGKPFELKLAGTYKVADLAAKIGSGMSVFNKYTSFILSKSSDDYRSNKISGTGAVHRGGKTLLKLFLPKDPKVFGTTMILEWEVADAGSSPYTIILKNIFGDELISFDAPETMVRIDLSDPKLVNESSFLIEVSSRTVKKVKAETIVMTRLSGSDASRTKKDLSELENQLTEETGLNKFILAGFYEFNSLLVDALTAYEDAIKLSPDVETFKKARDQFLYRNNLRTDK